MEAGWIKIAESIAELQLGENNLVEITVDGKKVCIGAFGTELRACAAKCPHAGVALETGYIDAVGNIVCPLHRYKFNMATGRNVTGEGYYLKTYRIEEREDGIYINFEKKKNLFDLFN